MKATIDRAGRLVIPMEIRKRAGLKPGTKVDIECSEGVIEISPELPKGKLVREGHLLVWHPDEGEMMTGEEMDRMIEEAREERLDEVARGSGL